MFGYKISEASVRPGRVADAQLTVEGEPLGEFLSLGAAIADRWFSRAGIPPALPHSGNGRSRPSSPIHQSLRGCARTMR
ncbi:hypothetical protein OHB33_00555 [Streptomyces sp. NBC_01558]|uniref:hypothetical protein n=1 Tax=Streptomyces sp. NBC_01558 TaxID=2975878 RepID=UPI002DDAAB05|nr:hypothetical protein [Streptomyces sp. NBC_01558]WSD74920.1 hypothetical protein OHB33_00555 [Streptomyces sp. NBC_01558]